MSVNKVILIGHAGRAPEIRTLDSGSKVCTLSIATSESYKDKEGKKVTTTDWHRLVAWGKLADIFEKYVDKGKQIYVEGKLRQRSYDGQDGKKVYVSEVVVNELVLLGSGQQTTEGNSKTSAGNAAPEADTHQGSQDEPDISNDLPF